MKNTKFFALALCLALLTTLFTACDKSEPLTDDLVISQDVAPEGLTPEPPEYIETPMSETLIHHYNPMKKEGFVKSELIDGVTHKYFDRAPTSEEMKNTYHRHQKDGKIFMSQEAMEEYDRRLKQRSADVFDVRFDPNGDSRDDWLLMAYNSSNTTWYFVSWLDHVTVTVGLPYGDDDCTNDHIVFWLRLWAFSDDCEEMRVKYYKNGSQYASMTAVPYSQTTDPGKGYYMRVKNGVQPSSPSVAILANDCINTTTHYNCEN